MTRPDEPTSPRGARPRRIDPASIPPDDLNRLLQSLAGLPSFERRLREIERELAFRAGEDFGGGNPKAAQPRTDDDDEASQQHRDPAWACAACGKVLGRYTEEIGEMRIKNRGSVIYVRVGPGGSIAIVCSSCGATNTADSDGREAVPRNSTQRTR